MSLTVRLFFLPCVFLSLVMAQTAAAQQAPGSAEGAFETASIRPVQLVNGCYSELPPGGKQYAVTCVTLRDLIARGSKIDPKFIEGGDAHALGVYYDVRASVPDGQVWTNKSIQPLIHQLLIERFHLEAHNGTKQVPGYELVIGKGGAKGGGLAPAESKDTQVGIKAGEGFQNYVVPGSLQGRGMNSSGIASLLSLPAHAVVVDRTGLSGIFNIKLHYAYEGSGDPNLPDFFTAVEEQLGLKLRPTKVTVNTLVIDHVDNEPTAN